MMGDLPYSWTHATCVDCGYHGGLQDFAATRFEAVEMPPLGSRVPPERYPRDIGDVCAICWAKAKAGEPVPSLSPAPEGEEER